MRRLKPSRIGRSALVLASMPVRRSRLPEGFIGSAVNMAARVCAAAAPGEVLVTGTVRGITRASIDVGFASRGKQRLGDESRSSPLRSRTAASTTPRRRSVDRRWLAAIGLGAVAVMALAFVALALPGPQRPRPPRHLSRLPNRWQLDRQRSERTRLRTSIRRFRSRSTIWLVGLSGVSRRTRPSIR